MIENFKKDIDKRLHPIINNWIQSGYFKGISKYATNPKKPLNARVNGLFVLMIYLSGKPKPKKSIDKIILYLKMKTVKYLFLSLDKRLKLQKKVNDLTQQTNKNPRSLTTL